MGRDWSCRDFSHQALTKPSQPDKIGDATFNFASSSSSCCPSVLINNDTQICAKLGMKGYFRSKLLAFYFYFINEMLFWVTTE